MAQQKLSPNQLRRIDEIQQFMRTVEHVKKLVAELDGNRAAKATVLNGICSTIAAVLQDIQDRQVFFDA